MLLGLIPNISGKLVNYIEGAVIEYLNTFTLYSTWPVQPRKCITLPIAASILDLYTHLVAASIITRRLLCNTTTTTKSENPNWDPLARVAFTCESS